jgi:hypothetical protein
MLSSAERLLGVALPLTLREGARVAPEGMAEGMFGGESAPVLRPILLVMKGEDVRVERERERDREREKRKS